ncbi:MAG TPA: hypothetical protein VHG51_13975 [Longimicrobiaceae bacterium]|nr:hypothetical protein [Longimicrobiaceae bacterium]
MSFQPLLSVLPRAGSPAVRDVFPAPAAPRPATGPLLDDRLQWEERTVRELRAELAAQRGRQRSAWTDLPALRREVGQAVELSSVRQVAGAVGTSHEGLRRFLNGGKPYPATLQKIVRWTERTRRAGVDAEPDAFELMTRGLSPEGKARVREAMRRALRESGEAVAPWLAEEAG